VSTTPPGSGEPSGDTDPFAALFEGLTEPAAAETVAAPVAEPTAPASAAETVAPAAEPTPPPLQQGPAEPAPTVPTTIPTSDWTLGEPTAPFDSILADPASSAPPTAVPDATAAWSLADVPPTQAQPAAPAAWASIKFLMRYFETNTLTPFAVYCLCAGVGALLVFVF